MTASDLNGSAPEDEPTLRDLQREFPQFAIWREVMPDRTRYNAQRIGAGQDLLPPGLVDVRDWRPGHATLRSRWGPRPAARFLAALARKPPPAL